MEDACSWTRGDEERAPTMCDDSVIKVKEKDS